MITIENLTVKVTYRVCLGGFKVPKKVFSQLNKIADSEKEFDGTGMDFPQAVEWLKDHIKQYDCCDLQYEIGDLY